jgi:hypothetical protein
MRHAQKETPKSKSSINAKTERRFSPNKIAKEKEKCKEADAVNHKGYSG